MPDEKYSGEELKIEFSDQAKQALESDPKLANGVRDLMAKFRQAQQAFHEGRYPSFEEALAALGVEAKRIAGEDKE